MSLRLLRRALIVCLAVLPLSASAAFGDGLKTLVGGLGSTLDTLGGGLGTTLGTLGGGLQETFERLKHQYLEPTEGTRSEEHTSELQSLMRISYAVFCLKKKHTQHKQQQTKQ